MAVAIPPPHVPLALGFSYLLDALVPVPLPFLFLSPASSLYGGLFHLFLGLFVPMFGSSGFQRFIALRLRQVFYAPPPRHSLIATFLSGVPARSRLSLLQLIILLLFYVFFGFPIFCFLCLFFVLLGLLVFALVFPCIAFFCLFCVCFIFTVLPIFSASVFAVLHPLSGLFSAPPPRQASNASFSVRGLLAYDRFYFPVFFCFCL
jgi:hypothetical protein